MSGKFGAVFVPNKSNNFHKFKSRTQICTDNFYESGTLSNHHVSYHRNDVCTIYIPCRKCKFEIQLKCYVKWIIRLVIHKSK